MAFIVVEVLHRVFLSFIFRDLWEYKVYGYQDVS